MEITYLNHSSFLIKTKFEGNKLTKIVTDPFSDEIGVKFKTTEADIVLVSSMSKESSNLSGIKGLGKEDSQNENLGFHNDKPFVVKSPGEFEVRGVHIKGIASNLDSKDSFRNTLYTISNESFKVCFLGGLNQILTENQIEESGEVDVLIVPVGGGSVLDSESAGTVISQIEPGFVLPMCYKTLIHNDSSNLKTLKDFLEVMGKEELKPSDTLVPTKTGEEETEVVVLKPQYE